MYVIRHHHGNVQVDALASIVKTRLEDKAACHVREGIPAELAKSHEDGQAQLLIVRQFAAVFVHSAESNGFGHPAIQVERTPPVCDD